MLRTNYLERSPDTEDAQMNDIDGPLKEHFIHSTAPLRIASLRIGRTQFNDIVVENANGAALLIEILRDIRAAAKRRRFDRKGQLYPQIAPHRLYPRKLSVEIADYVKIRANEGLEAQTVDKIKRTLSLLLAVCGDVYVSAITQANILQLQEFLLWTPKGTASAARLKTHTPEQLIAAGKAANLPRPAEETLDLHRRLLKTFFKNLVDQGILGHTPMACWKPKRDARVYDPTKEERVFSDEDLQKIFAPETFTDWARKWPHRYWGPILGLYTGARINEIAQLKLADIVEKNGSWWMHIRATVDEDLRDRRGRTSRATVKCHSSIRCIPIARPILDAGFLDFVADIREAKHERLFPNLSPGTDVDRARYGIGLSNQFSEYMKRLGFPKGVRFHAFRHTFVTVLLNEKISQVDIASVTGHALDKDKVERVIAYSHVGSPKRPAKATKVDEQRQIEVVAALNPPVVLPRYERGQFHRQLRKGAPLYL